MEYGVYQNDCVRISNAARCVEGDHILFAFKNEQEGKELAEYFKGTKNISFAHDANEEALKVLPGYKGDTAFSVPAAINPENSNIGGHLIAIEGNTGLPMVIARNLAAADNSTIVILPKVSDEERDEIKDSHRVWIRTSGIDRNTARQCIFDFIENRTSKLTGSTADSISFITNGIPYGVYPFESPVTHYFSFPLLGISILNGMLKASKSFLRAPVAILFDPNSVGDSEFLYLRDLFKKYGYIVRNSFGKHATVRVASNLTEFFPSDFIYYSTHCAELPGRRVTEKFTSKNGKDHILCYDQAAGFALEPGTEMVEVREFKRWISVDGVSWQDDEGKTRINVGEIVDEYIQSQRRHKQKNILHTEACGPIDQCSALGMSDDNYLPLLHDLGGHYHPLVFNNACSTWRDMAINFSCAGSSVFIGTSLDIPNGIAVAVAKTFSQAIVRGRAVGFSLYRAQKEYAKQLGYSPYLMLGYIFTKIPSLSGKPDNRLILKRRVEKVIKSWQQFMTEKKDNNGRKDPKNIIQFLQEELSLFLKTLS